MRERSAGYYRIYYSTGKDGIRTEKENLATKKDLVRETGFLRKEIAEAKTDMIKWFCAFFVTLALMIIGLF